MPPEPGTRSSVRLHDVPITIRVTIRTQWEQDHWIAEYHGITATSTHENGAVARLKDILRDKEWRYAY